ncbi:non-ribosomal peptide synthetase [Chitinophaga sp. GbtcB8]|uniref:non-ribosomal peptide synthetase n=1 Tax=Chitinophaga sp. GbtcB8 TaxID=2824753 RepID=UPI001C2FF6A8|nr:non-ribosomal peptide synthetase [Chitinophaga sp. GbtcB8]
MKPEINKSLASAGNMPANSDDKYPAFRNAVALLSGEEQGPDEAMQDHACRISLVGWPDVSALRLNFNSLAADREIAANLLNNFGNLLTEILKDPYCAIAGYRYIHPAEIKLLTDTFNSSSGNNSPAKSLITVFREIYLSHGDNIAISHEGRTLTYALLNARSDALSRFLIKDLSVRKGENVGILMDRSADMVTSILGTIMAGAVFIPIDPQYPSGRIASIIADSGIAVLITESFYMNDLMAIYTGRLLVIDLQETEIAAAGQQAVAPAPLSSEDGCYMLYTSGSTGTPKGVMISHGSIANYVSWANSYYFNDTTGHRFAFFTSPSFDLTLTSLFTTLLRGDCLEIFSESEGGTVLAKVFDVNSGVNTVKLTPSHIEVLREMKVADTGVRKVIVGGEALHSSHVRCLHAISSEIEIYNEYGPTEITIGCTVKKIGAVGEINIGVPMAGNRIYIVDDHYQLQPIGIAGEIVVAGPGLALGYFNQPEETDRKFIDLSNGPLKERRVYLTGDRGRWLPNGEIAYIGRKDRQVKIRGHRVEPGEVEAALRRQKDIAEAIVVVNNGQLIAYYRSSSSEDFAPSCLEQVLPGYMLPRQYIRLEKFPLTTNGKLDYSQLPDPTAAVQREYVAPRTAQEKLLAAIWKEVLERERVGINDNFFSLGGDSIKAISLVSKINKVFGVTLEIKDVFNQQSIIGLLERLEQEFQVENEEEGNAILQYLSDFKNKVTGDNEAAGIETGKWEDVYPLSDIEAGMIFHNRLQKAASTYHDQFFYQFKDNAFNLSLLQNALQKIADKHEILRSRYVINNTEIPYKIVMKPFDITSKMKYRNVSSEIQAVQKSVIEKDMELDRQQGFNDEPGLWRVMIYDMNNDEIGLLFSFHHAIIDGWSRASLITELNNLYQDLKQNNPVNIYPLKASYKDYLVEQLKMANNKEVTGFWKNELRESSFSGLPFKSGTYETKVVTRRSYFELDKELQHKLLAAASDADMSVKHVCFAVFLYLVHLTTLKDEVIVGLVSDGRPAIEDGEKIIGCFLNSVPFKLDVGAGKFTSGELLKRVNDKLINLKSVDKLSFVQIKKQLETDKNKVIFDVLFSYVDFHIYQHAKEVPVVDSIVEYFESTNTNFDFGFGVANNRMGYSIAYNPVIYHEAEIKYFGLYYKLLLEFFLENNSLPLSNNLLLRPEEINLLTDTFNSSSSNNSPARSLITGFREICLSHGDNIAISHEGKALTYALLEARSDALSHFLIKDLSVRKGENVGILLDRSADMVTSILGTIMAGAVFIPIDPQYPSGRIASIIADSGIAVLITESFYMNDLMAIYPGRLLVIDLQETEIAAAGQQAVAPAPLSSEDGCYMLYTSGSTGTPKGVMISHGSIANYVSWANSYYFNDTTGHRFAFFTSPSFDLTLTSLFTTLLRGDCLEIFSESEGGTVLAKVFDVNSGVNTVKLTPSHIEVLREMNVAGTGVRKVIVGGEALHSSHVRCLHAISSEIEIYNEYGPTEITIGCTVKKIGAVGEINIGVPMAGNRIYIVDDHYQLQPIGIAGEIVVAGPGLALGYFNQPEETDRKFIDLSNGPLKERRVYLTGDRGRWLPNGEVAYIGRKDRQVKIRGHRVEPGEVEAVLRRQKDIAEAIVVVNNGQLIAYYRSSSSEDFAPSCLEQVLPGYMIPRQYIRLEKFPLTTNGKLDYSQLPDPSAAVQREYVAPRTAQEKLLAAIWKEVLGREDIGINDNFFSLGGDSIIGIQICSRVQNKGYQLEVGDIFNKLSIQAIAADLAPLTVTSAQEEVTGEIPLTPIQHRFFQLYTVNPHKFHQAVIVGLEKETGADMLERVFSRLIQHHDALRITFDLDEYPGKVLQLNRPDIPGHQVYALGTFPTLNDPLLAQQISALHDSIQLNDASLIKAAEFKVNDKQHLIISVHHLVMDGVSWRILLEDLDTLLRSAGNAPLPMKTDAYKVWAESLFRYSLSDQLRQETRQLKSLQQGIPENVPAELDPDVPDYVGNERKVNISIGKQLTAQLLGQSLHEKLKTGITDFLVCALGRTYRQCFNREALYLSVESHGRDHLPENLNVSRTVGWFTNIYPVLLNGDEAGQGIQELRYCKETLNRAARLALAYNVAAYMLPAEDRLKLYRPAVCFNYLGQFRQAKTGSFDVVSMSLGELMDPAEIREYQFLFSGVMIDNDLVIQLAYNGKHFKEETMTDVLLTYKNNLAMLISETEEREGTLLSPSDLTYQGLSSGDLDVIDSLI